MIFTYNVDRLKTSLRKHNVITTNRLLKNTNMTTKLFLISLMDYFSGNKNLFYHQPDPSLYWLRTSVSFFRLKLTI